MRQDFHAKMKLLVKSEKALLSLEMRKKSRQTLWVALALLAVLLGLLMLNVTIYLYLSSMFSMFISAAILSGLNMFIAGIFFFIASRQDRGSEAQAIEDIRDFAWEQVSSDIDEVKQNVSEFKHSVTKLKHNIDSFTSGEAFGLKKILPIIATLIELSKKK